MTTETPGIDKNTPDSFCTSARPSTRELFTEVEPKPENGWVYADVRADKSIVVCAETNASDTCEVPLTPEEARLFGAWLLQAAGDPNE